MGNLDKSDKPNSTQPTAEALSEIRQSVMGIEKAKMKAHLSWRNNQHDDILDKQRFYDITELFTIEDMRWFWQRAFQLGFVEYSSKLEDMYYACQTFWRLVDSNNRYMDVMRWKHVKKPIGWFDFVDMMKKSYKTSHAQQMRRWREKYSDKLGELTDLVATDNQSQDKPLKSAQTSPPNNDKGVI